MLPLRAVDLKIMRDELAGEMRRRGRATNHTIETSCTHKPELLRRLALRRRAKDIGNAFEFAQIVGLEANRETRAFANGTIEVNVSLRGPQIAVVNREELIFSGVGSVQRALNG